MDEEISIIDTNTRIEKAKNFVIKHKTKIIFFISTIILLIFIFNIYSSFQKKNKIKIADKYNFSVANYKTEKKNTTENEMIEIINAKDKTYSPLALFFLIDNDIVKSNEKINIFFDIIIDEVSLDDEIKNLIIYKKAIFNSEFESENNLIKILNPIINSKSVWRSHALYLLAEYFYFKNERQKAKEFFNQILILENANSNIKIETQKRLQRDFSE